MRTPLFSDDYEGTINEDPSDNKMRLEWRDPRTLQPMDDNPKIHPGSQREAYRDFLEEVGWVGALLFNERTGHLLDGHMRQQDAIDRNLTRVPVLIVDVPEEDELKIVALLDPIGGLHRINSERLAELEQIIQTRSDMLRALLKGMTPEDDDEEESGGSSPRKPAPIPKGGLAMVLGEEYNYVVLLFKNSFDWTVAQDHFGLQRQRCAFHATATGIGRVIDGGAYLNDILQRLRNARES